MQNAKIKNIKTLPKKGDTLQPFDDANHGSVGKKLEKIVEDSGFTVNRGKGPDVHNVELKTMMKDTKSSVSICRSTTNEITNTPYSQSNFKSKVQQQAIVEYERDTGTVTDSDMYDMSDDETQQRLEDAYEAIRHKMQSVKHEKRIDGGDVIAERRKETHNSWQLRIPKKTVTKIKDHIKSKAIKDSIFEF